MVNEETKKDTSSYHINIQQGENVLIGSNSQMNIGLHGDTLTKQLAHSHADVLLVTTTQVEAKTVLKLFSHYQSNYRGDKTYFDLGMISDASIFMVRSEMGVGGAGGSLLTVQQSIEILSPTAVVMVGIAFGLRPEEQEIGDILVSQQVVDYESQKIKSGPNSETIIFPRGDRWTVPPRMIDRFSNGELNWKGSAVHFGLMLSGAKLVDHQGFRDQLVQREPEAIGGDMEAAGLCAAAQRNKIDWIVVKAISDWADGNKAANKDKCQALAAKNAACFTVHVLQMGGFQP
jgi:nucleoside phosphorylase